MRLPHKGSLCALYYLYLTIKLRIYRCIHRYPPTELCFVMFRMWYQLLAVLIAELGIRRAKEQYGLGKTLWFFSSLEGSIRLKYFISTIIRWPLRNILEVCMHVHGNFINFEKIFSKMLDYFRNFRKLSPSKVSRYMVYAV